MARPHAQSRVTRSVELVFDNSDNRLQGAWGNTAKWQSSAPSPAKVTITKYTIMVRCRDITDLFLAQVGARGYAVIEQGMISRIIEVRPEELRAHIEEAAGVSNTKNAAKELPRA